MVLKLPSLSKNRSPQCGEIDFSVRWTRPKNGISRKMAELFEAIARCLNRPMKKKHFR